ncbi:MAG: hypothetical protein R3D34_04730 [Nitratireductor sp.]
MPDIRSFITSLAPRYLVKHIIDKRLFLAVANLAKPKELRMCLALAARAASLSTERARGLCGPASLEVVSFWFICRNSRGD